ncbi:MAG TPA: hypothetical protein VIE68_08090 [Gemmatimonadota bacterium]|jgi:hypothetical protein
MARALAPILLIAGLLSSLPANARSQDLGVMAYGVRAGASLDDDLTQLLVGGQVDVGRLAENVRLQPFATIGFGDDALSVMLAAEAHYLFPVDPARSRIEPYAGAGLGLSHVNYDRAGRDDDTTEIALLLAGGVDVPVQRWWGWFGEVRFQIADESLFRLEGGLNWQY